MINSHSTLTRLQYWFLGLILLVALLSNFAGIRAIEFTGEDEVMFMVNGLSFLDGISGHLGRILEIFLFYYPPLQSIVPLPFVAGFGASEWTMRLPSALAGVLICAFLFRIVRRITADSRSALLASLLYAASGVSGNNKFALTGGLLSLGLIITFDGLSQFLESTNERTKNRALFWSAFGLIWATLSLQDGLFYIPTLAMAYGTQYRFKISRGTLPALIFLIIGIGGYILCWILLPRILCPSSSFGAQKVSTLLSQLGACRLRELMGGYTTATSLPVIGLALILLPLGFFKGSTLLHWMTLFYGFPLFLWTFVFDYPNLRVSHLLVAFPLFCALWAQGSIKIWDSLHQRANGFSCATPWLWILLMAWSVSATALQNVFLFGTDRLPQKQASLLGPVSPDYLPQGRRFTRFGQHAAGIWIRENTPPDQKILCNLGGSFSAYYAKRNDAPLNRLVSNGSNTARWKADNIRYLVHSSYFSMPKGCPSLELYTPAAQLVMDGHPILTIYDLWNETAHASELDYESAKLYFAQHYTSWRDYLR